MADSPNIDANPCEKSWGARWKLFLKKLEMDLSRKLDSPFPVVLVLDHIGSIWIPSFWEWGEFKIRVYIFFFVLYHECFGESSHIFVDQLSPMALNFRKGPLQNQTYSRVRFPSRRGFPLGKINHIIDSANSDRMVPAEVDLANSCAEHRAQLLHHLQQNWRSTPFNLRCKGSKKKCWPRV